MSARAMVLLSGGLDSSLVLLQALRDGCDVRALTVFYGQHAQAAEENAAGAVAKALGVQRFRAPTADAMPRPSMLSTSLATDIAGATSSAFVPGRNALLMSIAVSYAATVWPDGPLEVWVGACLDDQNGFPDCRLSFLRTFATMASSGLGREVSVVAPMVNRSKAEVVAALRWDETALRIARMSSSCYRGIRCGLCKPCALRANAFAGAGLEDAP